MLLLPSHRRLCNASLNAATSVAMATAPATRSLSITYSAW
jgi:hypothetical protein